jgi:hypothetical protein
MRMVGSSTGLGAGPRRGSLAVLAVLAAATIGGASLVVGHGSPPPVFATTGDTASSRAASVLETSPPSSSSDWASVSQRPTGLVATPVASPPVDPVTASTLEPDLVLAGSWTVRYTVGPENGDGVNIDLPLRRLDRRTIVPGATFDFWAAVGDVSRRAGYRMGAMIVGDHINPAGALAGGICTVSTALFNAAARAGIEITARTSHGGYLAKYPLGLDAAVAKGDGWAQTMAFRNDTNQTLLVRTVSAPGIARVDLYAAEALGRTVTLSEPAISHRVKATDRHVRTTALPAGRHERREDSSNGMRVVVERVVTDASGRVVHRDHWVSPYRPLRGLILDGTG